MSDYSSKRSLSMHQKQMRSLTIMLVLLLAVAFTALMYWLNR
jgi:membrane protein YdbS with pleckstrin-like domain